MIITRIWHGVTPANMADEYLSYLKKTGVRDYRKIEGNRGVQVWRRIEKDQCHFWTISRWDNYESIKKFAGEDYEKARYYDEDKQYLLDFEEKVIHVETFEF